MIKWTFLFLCDKVCLVCISNRNKGLQFTRCKHPATFSNNLISSKIFNNYYSTQLVLNSFLTDENLNPIFQNYLHDKAVNKAVFGRKIVPNK